MDPNKKYRIFDDTSTIEDVLVQEVRASHAVTSPEGTVYMIHLVALQDTGWALIDGRDSSVVATTIVNSGFLYIDEELPPSYDVQKDQFVVITKICDGGIDTEGKVGRIQDMPKTSDDKFTISFSHGYCGVYSFDEFRLATDQEINNSTSLKS